MVGPAASAAFGSQFLPVFQQVAFAEREAQYLFAAALGAKTNLKCIKQDMAGESVGNCQRRPFLATARTAQLRSSEVQDMERHEGGDKDQGRSFGVRLKLPCPGPRSAQQCCMRG